MNSIAATINNPTPAHIALVTLRETGHCLVKERAAKLTARMTIYVGHENPEKTPHIQIGAFSEKALTKIQWQRLFTPKGMDYKQVWIGNDMPGADKGPTYWAKYCGDHDKNDKNTRLPTIVVGNIFTDEEHQAMVQASNMWGPVEFPYTPLNPYEVFYMR